MAETTAKKQVIKGGEFIIRESGLSDIFIPEEMNEEQKMIRQMVSDFLKEAGGRVHQLEEQVALLEKTGELGLLGSHIPEVYGGMPLETNTNTMLLEEMGKAGASFNTTFAAHTGIGMLPILYFGTEAQKEKFLPALCTGAWKAAYCLTEPGSGSDAMGIKSRADLSEDGSTYVLNGQKMWISNAGFADIFIVFAKVGGTDFTGFIVEANSPGITLGEEEHKMGIKGSSTRQVFFENVRVPAENVLGEIGKGHLIAFNALNVGRFKLGAMAMGGCKMASSISVQYANARIQFGKPISSFGAIRYKLAQQAILTFVLESAVYRVSDMMQDARESLMEAGKGYEEAMLLAAKEYAVECAIVKVAGSEYLDYVIDEMVQVHGGYGYSEEYPAAVAYRDARINRIYEGTNEINRLLMVSQILKRAFKGQLDLIGPAWDVQKELTRMPSFGKPDGALGMERKAVRDFKKILLMVAGAAAKYQMDGHHDLTEEQEIVTHIANIMMDTFLAESVLLRIDKMEQGSFTYPKEVIDAMLRVYLHDTQAHIVKNGTDALASFAKGDELTIMLKGLRRFSKYPAPNVKALRRTIAAHLIGKDGYAL